MEGKGEREIEGRWERERQQPPPQKRNGKRERVKEREQAGRSARSTCLGRMRKWVGFVS